MSDELDGVDGGADGFQHFAVFRQRAPRKPFAQQRGPVAGKPRLAVARHDAPPALAVHLGGDALAQLARRVRLQHQIGVAVAVRIDEARRHHAAGRVHDIRSRRRGRIRRHRLHGRDTVPFQDHVAAKRGLARAIDNQSVGDSDHACCSPVGDILPYSVPRRSPNPQDSNSQQPATISQLRMGAPRPPGIGGWPEQMDEFSLKDGVGLV